MAEVTTASPAPPQDSEAAAGSATHLDDSEETQEYLNTQRSEFVLTLKRQALAAKKSDQLSEALKLLKQAKELESCPLDSLHCNPIYQQFVSSSTRGQSPDDDQDGDLELLQEAALDVAFTDDELMNEEMITEFALGGMDVPSDQVYQAAILKYKQAALQYKQQGDIPKATANLKNAKQLQKVQVALQKIKDGVGLMVNEDIEGWMEALNDEDSALLGELMKPQDNDNSLLATNGSTTLELQDLELMDDSDIKEYMQMGDGVPTANDLLELAKKAQDKALEHKQKGNIEMAKASLVESKKYKVQAERVDRITHSNNGGEGKVITDEDLENLLNGTPKAKSIPKAAPTPPANPWLQKPSEEVKQEVLRLKNEGKIQEATQLLKIYKEVAKKEADLVETERCRKLRERIQREVDVCEQQIKMFAYFERLCEADDNHSIIGAEQGSRWKAYQVQCRHAIQTLQDKGSNGLSITLDKPPSDLFEILEEDVVGMVEAGCHPGGDSGPGLETVILGLVDIHENKSLKKILLKLSKTEKRSLPIKVEVKFQLPAYTSSPEEQVSGGYTLTFLPASQKEDTSAYVFPMSQHMPLPPKESKQAKTILRRMETKKVQVSVYYDHLEEKRKAKSSWFGWGKASSDGDTINEEQGVTMLGKVILELNGLLRRNCLAGDFPLQVNSKDVGGTVRLCIRTKEALDPSRFEGVVSSKSKTPMKAYETVLSFSSKPISNV